ncbi:C4-dicarboxylate transporter DctA, partial [Burkholderia gladioli]
MNQSAALSQTARSPRKPFYRALYVQVFAAIVLGVLLGHFAPSLAVKMKPLGDA